MAKVREEDLLKVVGVTHVDRNKDGKRTTGVRLYVQFTSPNIDGMGADVLWCNDQYTEGDLYDIKPGDMVAPVYNRYGSLVRVDRYEQA